MLYNIELTSIQARGGLKFGGGRGGGVITGLQVDKPITVTGGLIGGGSYNGSLL